MSRQSGTAVEVLDARPAPGDRLRFEAVAHDFGAAADHLQASRFREVAAAGTFASEQTRSRRSPPEPKLR